MIKYVWATQSRSGSQFLLDLTMKALPASEIWPQSRINGCGADTQRKNENELKCLLDNNRPLYQYFQKHHIKAVKVEEPSMNRVGYKLMQCVPNACWLASVRKIEDIVVSHYNIKSWGFPEAKVLRLWRANLNFYEHIFKTKNPLLLIDVRNPKNNNIDLFCKFLGVSPTSRLQTTFDEWGVINPLSRQKRIHNESDVNAKEIPHNISTLRSRYKWVDLIEHRYQVLFQRCLHELK